MILSLLLTSTLVLGVGGAPPLKVTADCEKNPTTGLEAALKTVSQRKNNSFIFLKTTIYLHSCSSTLQLLPSLRLGGRFGQHDLKARLPSFQFKVKFPPSSSSLPTHQISRLGPRLSLLFVLSRTSTFHLSQALLSRWAGDVC